MKIVVCCKFVLDPTGFTTGPGGSLDLSRAKPKLSDYDRNAIQAAVDLAGPDGEVVALSYGPPGTTKLLKDALARGAHLGWSVSDPAATRADGRATAIVLAAAVRAIGDVDLVVCAEGAADTYAHEVGPRVGALLGWPVLSHAASVELVASTLSAVRAVRGGVERLQTDLPAVLTVMPTAAAAPIPTLKAVLAANKLPIVETTPSELGLEPAGLEPRVELVALEKTVVRRKREIVAEAGTAQTVEALLARLEAEGVLA